MLDLGQRIQVTCNECSITYDRSDSSDCAAHERQHLRQTRGIEWTGKQVMRQAKTLTVVPLRLASRGREKKDETVTLLSYDWQRVEPSTLARLCEVQEAMDSALGAVPMATSLRAQTSIILAVCGGRVVGSLIAGPTPKGTARIVKGGVDADNDGAVIAA